MPARAKTRFFSGLPLTPLQGRRRLPWLGCAAAAVVAASSVAGAQGVQYTVMPSAAYVRWESGLGLERAIAFGGAGVIDFGRLVALETDYRVSGGVVARFSESGLTDSLGAPLENGTLDVTMYGLRVRMNVGNARLAPFLRAGGSLIRFDEGARSGPRQIAVAYGGGMRLNFSPRVRAELFAEDLQFRIDRSALASGARSGTDPERDELRSNITFGAGVGFVVGGAPASSASSERWSFASVPLEAFTGRLDFADPALGTPFLVGIRAGIDAGNYVGLRAYYMRGVSSDYSALEGVESLGGEAQFNLNASPTIAPYLLVGGGTLGFATDYRDRNGDAPPDRTVLILGAGTGIRLTDKLRLNVAARDFVHGREANLDEVAEAGDVRHNWLYSAGISFSVGRSRRGVALLPNVLAVDTATAALTDTTGRLAAANASLPADSAGASRVGVVAPAGDTIVAGSDSLPAMRMSKHFHSGRTVVLPIPTEGELYIRYGPPAGADSLNRPRQAGSPTPPEGSAAPAETNPGEARDTALVGAMIRRLFDERRRADSLRMHDLIATEMDRWRADQAAGRAASTTTPVAPSVAEAGRSPSDADLIARLEAQRETAVAEQRRLQRRVDSLEQAFNREAAARSDAEQDRQRALDDVARDAQAREAAARDADARAAEASNAEARDADARAAEARDAEAREAAAVARRRYDALTLVERSIPSVVEVHDSERGMVVVLGNDLFDIGRGSPGSRARRELAAVASLLALYPDAAIIVEGHTDTIGTTETNQRLSEERAESVRSALIVHGVASDRITARGYGEERPLADNGTAEGRARNRRAEIVIVGAQRPRLTAGP